VAEAISGDVVVAHLGDEFRPQRLPLGAPGVRPTAWAAGRVAREARRLDQALERLRQRRPLCIGDAGGEADMVEAALVVVEAKEQRADLAALRFVPEAADDAIGRAHALDLEHGALAGFVRALDPLRHDAIDRTAGLGQPLLRLGTVAGTGGQPKQTVTIERLREGLELRPSLAQANAAQVAPVGVSRRSNRMSRAGVSRESLRMRLSAGCRRSCSASNERVSR
jgi:hypothetical protein